MLYQCYDSDCRMIFPGLLKSKKIPVTWVMQHIISIKKNKPRTNKNEQQKNPITKGWNIILHLYFSSKIGHSKVRQFLSQKDSLNYCPSFNTGSTLIFTHSSELSHSSYDVCLKHYKMSALKSLLGTAGFCRQSFD